MKVKFPVMKQIRRQIAEWGELIAPLEYPWNPAAIRAEIFWCNALAARSNKRHSPRRLWDKLKPVYRNPLKPIPGQILESPTRIIVNAARGGLRRSPN